MSTSHRDEDLVTRLMLRVSLEDLRRAMALDRWVLGGVCAMGAWLIYLMTSQLGEFRGTLRTINEAMQASRMATERVVAQVEALDASGGRALREHERTTQPFAHPEDKR